MTFWEKIQTHKKGKKEATGIRRKPKTYSNRNWLFGFIDLPVFWNIIEELIHGVTSLEKSSLFLFCFVFFYYRFPVYNCLFFSHWRPAQILYPYASVRAIRGNFEVCTNFVLLKSKDFHDNSAFILQSALHILGHASFYLEDYINH